MCARIQQLVGPTSRRMYDFYLFYYVYHTNLRAYRTVNTNLKEHPTAKIVQDIAINFLSLD